MQELLRVASAVCFLVFGCTGCGEGTSEYIGGITEVVEIDSDDTTIPLGDGSVVRVNFSFDQNEVFSEDGSISLVLKFPRQLSYRQDSAEIDKSGSRDRDVDPRVKRCGNGDPYLVFTLGESELDDAAPPGEFADAQLKLTLDGERQGEFISIQGVADENIVPFSCTSEFDFDEQEIVSVR